MSEKPIELWKAHGRRCILTPITSDAPFEVTVFDGAVELKRRMFNTHQDAAEFAITEMREALASSDDPAND